MSGRSLKTVGNVSSAGRQKMGMGMTKINADEVRVALLALVEKIMRPVQQASVDLDESERIIAELEAALDREVAEKKQWAHEVELLRTELSLVSVELADRKNEVQKLANERDEALKKLNSMLARVGALSASVYDVMDAASQVEAKTMQSLQRPANVEQILESMKETMEGHIRGMNEKNQLFHETRKVPDFLTAPRGR